MNLCEGATIVLVSLLAVLQYTLPAPIFPIEMKHRDISQIAIGISIAGYSIGNMLGSIIPTDGLYQRLGRRKTSQCGFVMLSISLVFYAISYFLPDHPNQHFLFASILSRIF